MTTPSKLSPALAARKAEARPEDLLELIVELRPPSVSRAAPGKAAMEERRSAFERDCAPIGEAVRKAGGRIVGSAWLNSTLKVLVPAHALDELSGLGIVQALDVPRPLRPDAAGHHGSSG